ncbi:MAG: glycosyl hydrolase [Planctomycetota bacterium]
MARLTLVLLALWFATHGLPAQAPPMPAALLETLQWRCVGPSRGGRVDSVCGVVGDRNTYYMGACGGGVWKTTDAGRTWKNVSDGFFGGSIGAVAVAESDPNVVYAGTGEETLRGNVSSGDGVWRSTDAGKTWKCVGLADTRHVGRIRVHPRNADVVFVAAIGHVSGPNAERGVFRSKDGGGTWEKVLFVSDRAGAVDLCFDPRNPRILFASTWRVLRTPHGFDSGGEGSGLWRSSDGGDSWQNISGGSGLPEGTLGIIGVCVSPVDSERVWAMVEAEAGGLFRSDDGGGTWTKVNDERSLRQRAWYYTRVYADPQDRDGVYVLNVGFHKSTDGGRRFAAIRPPHGDNHDLWIDPADPSRMIEGNDGGACVSFDGGASWSTLDNQPTAQFYRVTTDNAVPYRIYGAQQDNSTLRIRSRSDRGRIGERDWEPTAGSESGHIAVHPQHPDVVFGGNYGGMLQRIDHATSERRQVNVWPDNPMGWGAADLRYRFQWNFPIFFSPHPPHALYCAGNVLFRSSDQGHSWQAISGDLTRDDKSKQVASGGPITKDNTGVEYYCTIFAACESPLEPGLLWCGSDDGLVHVSRDGGGRWQNVTPSWPEWMMVNCIEPHPSKPGTAYVAGTRYKLDDFAPYLFKTDDYGQTWTRINEGIAPTHFTRAVRCDPARAGLLYAGTERGVYVTFDDGARWQPLQLNLPVTPITDLAVKEGDLVAATQGRALWVLDDLAHLRQLDARQARARVHLFAPEAVDRMPGGGGRGAGGDQVGANPPAGAVVRVLLAEVPKGRARLEWIGPGGEVIAEMTSAGSKSDADPSDAAASEPDADEDEDGGRRGSRSRKLVLKAGMNRIEWDLRYDGAKQVPGMILWNGGARSGPRAVPGRYTVRLSLGDGDEPSVHGAEFDLRADPRSGATVADLRAQLTFLLEARDKLTETHEAIVRLRGLRQQVGAVAGRAEGDAFADLRTLGAAIEKEATSIEAALYQTKNRSNQDPLNFPIRLNDKLAGVMGTVAAGDCAPTQQALAVKAELVAAIDKELGRLQTLQSEQVARFNREAAAAGLPHVLVK